MPPTQNCAETTESAVEINWVPDVANRVSQSPPSEYVLTPFYTAAASFSNRYGSTMLDTPTFSDVVYQPASGDKMGPCGNLLDPACKGTPIAKWVFHAKTFVISFSGSSKGMAAAVVDWTKTHVAGTASTDGDYTVQITPISPGANYWPSLSRRPCSYIRSSRGLRRSRSCWLTNRWKRS